MGIPWISTAVVWLAVIAADGPDTKTNTKPEPPIAPDEWTKAVEGKVGLWQVVKGEPKVVDGVIAFPKGNAEIRGEHLQREFVLSFEWRGAVPGELSVFFGAARKEGNSWGYAVNHDRSKDADRPIKPGEWNSVEIEVQGRTFRSKINGRESKSPRKKEPENGAITLYARVRDGSTLELRNLSIVEKGYRPLFNGKDLEGWTGGGNAEDCWKVDAGLLQCTGAKGPWLRSNEEFGDFNLRLEYRLPPAGNSGVYVRVPPDGKHHGPGSGVEIQVLDDAHKSYAKLQKYQYTGSVYAVAPATQRVARPAGEWNSLEINCKGQTYRVVHNGETIVDVDEAKFPALKERRLQGFFGLQNHSSVVSFRNIRLGPAE